MIIDYTFYRDEDDCYPDTFQYQVDYRDLERALEQILVKEIKGQLPTQEQLQSVAHIIISDLDMADEFAKRFKDEVADYFEKDAYELYRDRDV